MHKKVQGPTALVVWIEGLSRMLSGINAATSRGVISAPMSHNLVMQNGERFTFHTILPIYFSGKWRT